MIRTMTTAQDGEEIEQIWHGEFVFFAYVVSFVASYSAVHLLDHSLWRSEKERDLKIIKYPMVLASIILGGGAVWSMHFVGMAAVSLGDATPICYNWPLTLASLAAAIICMLAGIKVASLDVFAGPNRLQSLKDILRNNRAVTHKKNSKQAIWAIQKTVLFYRLQYIAGGSFFAASGAIVMHYTGMMALNGPIYKEWSIPYIAASCVIGLVVCFVGFWIIFRLRWKAKQFWLRYLSAAVIALSFCGLHFFGMLGVTYFADSSSNACSHLIDDSTTVNDWTPHQDVVVAVCLAVPLAAVVVENLIEKELSLAYRKVKDPNFANLFESSSSTRTVHVTGVQLETQPSSISGKFIDQHDVPPITDSEDISPVDNASDCSWDENKKPEEAFLNMKGQGLKAKKKASFLDLDESDRQ